MSRNKPMELIVAEFKCHPPSSRNAVMTAATTMAAPAIAEPTIHFTSRSSCGEFGPQFATGDLSAMVDGLTHSVGNGVDLFRGELGVG